MSYSLYAVENINNIKCEYIKVTGKSKNNICILEMREAQALMKLPKFYIRWLCWVPDKFMNDEFIYVYVNREFPYGIKVVDQEVEGGWKMEKV